MAHETTAMQSDETKVLWLDANGFALSLHRHEQMKDHLWLIASAQMFLAREQC
jgi:hypothetical protein